MPFRKWLPENARPGLVLKPHPESGELIMRLTEILLRGPSTLTSAQRELIAAYTSAVNACEFCYGTHAATAEALGIDETWLTRLIDDIETADVDEELKPILRYVRKLTRTPSRVQQKDVDAIFAAGWDEDAGNDATESFNFGDWRAARQKVSITRIGPPKRRKSA